MTKDEFLFEAQRISKDMQDLIEKYGQKEEIISLFVTGVIDDKGDEKQMRAVYGMHVMSEDELAEVLEFLVDAYIDTADDNPFGFDISLN